MMETKEAEVFASRNAGLTLSASLLFNLMVPVILLNQHSCLSCHTMIEWAGNALLSADRIAYLGAVSPLSVNAYVVTVMSATIFSLYLSISNAHFFKVNVIDLGLHAPITVPAIRSTLFLIFVTIFASLYLIYAGTPKQGREVDALDSMLVWPWFPLIGLLLPIIWGNALFQIIAGSLKFCSGK